MTSFSASLNPPQSSHQRHFHMKFDRVDGLKLMLWFILKLYFSYLLLQVGRGGYENWQQHLKAAPDLFPFLTTDCTHEVNPLEFPANKGFDSGNQPISDTPYLSFTDHQAMELNSGVIIWVDILGSASTGERPQYSDICTEALGDNSKLQLKVVMGCENWAMIASK